MKISNYGIYVYLAGKNRASAEYLWNFLHNLLQVSPRHGAIFKELFDSVG